MDAETTLETLLTAWRSDIESVPVPELVSVDIALAALAVQRIVTGPRPDDDEHQWWLSEVRP